MSAGGHAALSPAGVAARGSDRFADALARIERTLEVPYPQRALLLDEIAADLEAAYDANVARGQGDAAARAAALAMFELDAGAGATLRGVHLPIVQRALARLSPPARDWLDAAASALPLAGFAVFLVMEVPMILFLREAGVVIYLILGIGALGLLLQLQRATRWFVLRDHSERALAKNTKTPLYLAGATMLLGVSGTALGYYLVLTRWSAGELTDEMLKLGLKEPLSAVITAGLVAALLVLMQAGLQAGLRGIRAPRV